MWQRYKLLPINFTNSTINFIFNRLRKSIWLLFTYFIYKLQNPNQNKLIVWSYPHLKKQTLVYFCLFTPIYSFYHTNLLVLSHQFTRFCSFKFTDSLWISLFNIIFWSFIVILFKQKTTNIAGTRVHACAPAWRFCCFFEKISRKKKYYTQVIIKKVISYMLFCILMLAKLPKIKNNA